MSAHPRKRRLRVESNRRKALSIALQVKGMVFLAPACLEIWQGVMLPMDAITASLLMLAGILMGKNRTAS